MRDKLSTLNGFLIKFRSLFLLDALVWYPRSGPCSLSPVYIVQTISQGLSRLCPHSHACECEKLEHKFLKLQGD